MKVITLPKFRSPEDDQLPKFMKKWLEFIAPELESHALILEKIQCYFFASSNEALRLEKEIDRLYTRFYEELIKSKKLTFMATMQGFRGIACDYTVKDVSELDYRLSELQRNLTRHRLMKDMLCKREEKLPSKNTSSYVKMADPATSSQFMGLPFG